MIPYELNKSKSKMWVPLCLKIFKRKFTIYSIVLKNQIKIRSAYMYRCINKYFQGDKESY